MSNLDLGRQSDGLTQHLVRSVRLSIESDSALALRRALGPLGFTFEHFEIVAGRNAKHASGSEIETSALGAALDEDGLGLVITGANLERPGPKIQYLNHEFIRMTGYASDELIGRSPRVLQGPATDRDQIKELKRCLKRQAYYVGDGVNYCKNGVAFQFEWMIAPMRNRSSRIVRWLSVQKRIGAL